MSEYNSFFKVNAAIKNIIGKELIYSDNIAIVELIKNSKDANANDVRLFFDKEKSLDEGSITIIDNGKGMSLSDIKNKWLNIAYSEKREKHDERIAGNKGIGRFSCDRLGAILELYTKTFNGPCLKFVIDWDVFENQSIDKEITSIPITIQEISSEDFLLSFKDWNVESGTALRISKLRNVWDANRLKSLISELERFSPELENTFNISVFADDNNSELLNKINKKINNNILDKVSFKTTYIKSDIDAKGELIETTLYYQKKKLYHYSVKNPYQKLKNISVEVHYIDPLARAYFTRNLGVKLVDYGSIFLFYNNFRISPYGNAKNDWLGLDQRKAQGRARYLGTREVIGKIIVTDTDEAFQVLSNREGLANNQAFHELIAYDKDNKTSINDEYFSYGYVINIIRQLESFVVDALDWNRLIDTLDPKSTRVIQEKDLIKNPNQYQIKEIDPEKIELVRNRLLKSEWNIDTIEINYELISHISQEAKQKYDDYINDFVNTIENKDIKNLSRTEIKKVKNIIASERQRAENATNERYKEEQKRLKAEKIVKEKELTIEQINSQNMFLRKSSNTDVQDLLSCIHSILVRISSIQNNVTRIMRKSSNLLQDDLVKYISNIRESSEIIKKICEFATLKNFSDKQSAVNAELSTFIYEYLETISDFEIYRSINIINKIDKTILVNREFIPVEIMMMVDNILVNSKKAHSDKIFVRNFEKDNKVVFSFKDNGNGLSEKYKNNPSKIFDIGETTTKGSGIGLYQVNKVVQKLGAEIFLPEEKSGFTIEVIF